MGQGQGRARRGDPVVIDFLSGGGEMGARMRALDWSSTPLGDPAGWPQSLRTVVRILLTSRYAMWMAWGPDLTFFYNDAYRPTLGEKESRALGQRSDTVWSEIWPDIGPLIDRVLTTGEATWEEGMLLFLERNGYPEETYHTFSYSPLDDDEGVTTGMLCVVTEVTEGLIGARRLDVLRQLGGELAGVRRSHEIGEAIGRCLNQRHRDLPFGLTYLFDDEANAVRLDNGEVVQDDWGPAVIEAGVEGPWPLAELKRSGRPVVVSGLAARFEMLPPGPSDRPPYQAILMPIARQGQSEAWGVFVAGLNPFRPLDDGYRDFIALFVGQIAAALSAANAFEEEQRRAEALAELDRAKTTFFSNVSHEFRTPLTLMLGPLEGVLADSQLPEADRAQIDVAHRNGVRLLKLVNSLLDFSRIEAGRVQAQFQPTDLGRLTAELASGFRSATDRAGLALRIEAKALPDDVYLDRDMWEKVVLNLLSNAFKFTFSGEIAVVVDKDPGGGGARLRVSDTGVGIPPAEQPRLFERFHRVKGARGRSFEGSGIGLALVHELVTLHGGQIEVESTPGAGSAFTVRLPFGSAHLPAEQVREVSTAGGVGGAAQSYVEEALSWLLKPETPRPEPDLAEDEPLADASEAAGRILLADDNADMRGYVRRLLVQRGYEVVSVADGEAALAEARRNPFDLMLSDIMMPKLDGFELLAALRADPDLKDLPVILLSARAGEEARVDGLDAGADDYLTKPFSARELIARVGASLNLSRARREAAASLRSANENLAVEIEHRTRERDRAWRNSRDLMAVVDAQGVFQAANPAWKTILDLDEADLRGRHFSTLIHPEDLADTQEAHDRSVKTGVPRFENRLRRKDGAYRWISWVTAPEDDVVYAFGRDVSEEKAQAEALKRTEEALRQAQKMEAMGQLTGGVAHDFNNLLTPILGGLDMLQRRGPRDAREERILSGALQSAERAKTLLQRLLAFARRQPLQATAVDLGQLVDGMKDLLTSTVGPRIAISVELEPALPAANADVNQIEMALLNLALNARDAMPDGGALRISATTRRLAGPLHGLDPGQYVVLSVADTGVGMDEATLRRAVEPFFSTKGVGKGTGLGLSMVHGLVAQLGGAVVLSSAPGQGATVELMLPEAMSSAAQGEADPEPVRGAEGIVLLVDDEDLVRSTTADMLIELGFDVVEARSAAEALRLLDEGVRADILLTDHLMPGMTGVELISEVRRRGAVSRALLMSGYAQTDGVSPSLRRLTKPFRQAELSNGLAEVLQLQTDEAASAES